MEQENVDAADLVLTGPSNAGNVTDKEEDDEQVFSHNGLPGEVSGDIEVVTKSIDTEEKDDQENSDGGEPPRKQKKNKTMKGKTKKKPQWSKSHLKNLVIVEDVASETISPKLFNMHPELSDQTEWEVFESFFSDIENLLVEQTNRYANRNKNNLQFSVTNDEMLKFIGIIFLSGYNQRTSETDYCSKSPDLECSIVASTMSRTRFQHIKSYLRAADNQNLAETKMAKAEPLYQLLNEKFQRSGIFHENLSIDESMVPYFGRHLCKQFIRGKPIRFGYKIRMLASNTGLPYRVAVYQDRKDSADIEKPLGFRVVTS